MFQWCIHWGYLGYLCQLCNVHICLGFACFLKSEWHYLFENIFQIEVKECFLLWVVKIRLGRERTYRYLWKVEIIVFKTFSSPSLLYYMGHLVHCLWLVILYSSVSGILEPTQKGILLAELLISVTPQPSCRGCSMLSWQLFTAVLSSSVWWHVCRDAGIDPGSRCPQPEVWWTP